MPLNDAWTLHSLLSNYEPHFPLSVVSSPRLCVPVSNYESLTVSGSPGRMVGEG